VTRRLCTLERAWIKANSWALKIVLDRNSICRYFAVTSDVRPLRRVLTEREEQTMGHDNLAMNDARPSMMVSWDAFITQP
jgi:hypothetical protein